MAAMDKYRQVVDMMNSMHFSDVKTEEQGGTLKVWATANTPYEKDMIWDKIKQTGGENPSDINADIKVKNNEYYALHKISSGETLSAISKKYYGDAGRYNEIAKFNNISNPDKIQAGQEIKIPNR